MRSAVGIPGLQAGEDVNRLHKQAVDIAFIAAKKISEKLGGRRVEIGMPCVEA